MGVVLLWIRKNGKSEYIAILLLCLGLAILNETYGDAVDYEFHLLYPFKFFFLIPNLVLLYVESKMNESISWKKVSVNLLAGVLEFVILLLILVLSKFELLDPNGDFLYYFDETYSYLTVLYILSIQIIILKKIAVYNGNLFKYFSTVRYKYLDWLKWVCVIFIINEIYYILFYIFSPDVENNEVFYLPIVLLELGLVFYIGIAALLQSNLPIEVPNSLFIKDCDKKDDKSNKYEDELFSQIEQFMQTQKPFLNSDLNLRLLSQLMQIPERSISNTINKSAGSNFYSYINQYRVQEAIRMLKSDDYSKFSIVGIGEASGFNSKSSFYNNFKRVTQTSPSKYLENMSRNTF